MADVTRFWIFLVLSTVCVNAGVLTGKAFYCRDPDTGKLHAVNSTWPSSSFCGNYTCKLKRINITEMEYVPLRQINITNNDSSTEGTIGTTDDKETSTAVTIERKAESIIQPLLHKEMPNDEPKRQDKKLDNGDRYLTETEIKTISELLHTVKKSDLDAIVDLYNIAQDIYKEIDKTTTEKAIDGTKNIKQDEKKEQYDRAIVDNKHTSYWYEPLNNNLLKAKPDDMEHQGSNAIQSTVPPKTQVRPSYLNGPLTSKDFGKLSYYYPMSPFQQMSSYVHQPSGVTKPCNNAIEHAMINRVIKKPSRSEQKLIQPSIFLPYPFSYVHNYNASGYLNHFYYGTNPWVQSDMYNKRNYPYAAAYIAQVPSNAVLVNPHLRNNAQDYVEQNSVSKEENTILDALIARAKESKLPDWQTPPLPAHVLEEVRANIEKSQLLKPFSLRKKVNLERVGKLIKLDDFARFKREVKSDVAEENLHKENVEIINDNNEFYHVHLETITCHSDTQPGYFRMGNIDQPFPNCCPQRINKPIH